MNLSILLYEKIKSYYYLRFLDRNAKLKERIIEEIELLDYKKFILSDEIQAIQVKSQGRCFHQTLHSLIQGVNPRNRESQLRKIGKLISNMLEGIENEDGLDVDVEIKEKYCEFYFREKHVRDSDPLFRSLKSYHAISNPLELILKNPHSCFLDFIRINI